IPGAAFFDIEQVSDPDSPYPHSWPPAFLFASRMRALGLDNHDRIVVYDNSPIHTSARAWWMLRSFGARQIAILDGGLAKWVAEGRALDSGAPPPAAGHFAANPPADGLLDKHAMLALVGDPGHAIADARPAARFRADAP